ncbi:MAG: four helix bundle protein [Cytophagales bacterium]|nr:four helix bundle protein [Cytophagales bacterium]
MDEKLLNRNRNINRGFRKLEIWQLAIELYILVHKILKKNPQIPFKVKAQIEDSALSMSGNIAEGYSRRSIKENLRYYEISLSSAAENYTQMFALQSTSQISKDDFIIYDDKIYEFENKMIKMNKNLISKLNSNDKWKSNYQ